MRRNIRLIRSCLFWKKMVWHTDWTKDLRLVVVVAAALY
jgi:hypothetical protein